MTAAAAGLPRLLTIEEYCRLDDSDAPTELVRGEIVEGRFKYLIEGFVCSNINGVIGEFVDQYRLGRMFLNIGVITERDPDTLRAADICYFSYARLPAGPLPREGYLAVMPDLVFEVRSPSDHPSQLLAKMTEFLTAGVTVVCVVNPETGTAVVYRDNQDPEPVAADAELTLPDVLPGFRVPLREFFE